MFSSDFYVKGISSVITWISLVFITEFKKSHFFAPKRNIKVTKLLAGILKLIFEFSQTIFEFLRQKGWLSYFLAKKHFRLFWRENSNIQKFTRFEFLRQKCCLRICFPAINQFKPNKKLWIFAGKFKYFKSYKYDNYARKFKP